MRHSLALNASGECVEPARILEQDGVLGNPDEGGSVGEKLQRRQGERNVVVDDGPRELARAVLANDGILARFGQHPLASSIVGSPEATRHVEKVEMGVTRFVQVLEARIELPRAIRAA